MKRIILVTAVLLFSFLCISAAWYFSKFTNRSTVSIANKATIPGKSAMEKLAGKVAEAKKFAAAHQYNTGICFLIDMSIESGRNRFFIYDLREDSLLDAGLVTHGNCNEWWLNGRRFGNEVGCGCTSLGKYKIGNHYNGKFGLAYKLY